MSEDFDMKKIHFSDQLVSLIMKALHNILEVTIDIIRKYTIWYIQYLTMNKSSILTFLNESYSLMRY